METLRNSLQDWVSKSDYLGLFDPHILLLEDARTRQFQVVLREGHIEETFK